MDPLDINSEKVTPERSRSNRSATILALIIIALQIILSLVTYPFLPASVPSHWDAAGQVNGYSPRWFTAILLPGMSLAIFLLIRFLVALGPRLGKQNQRATEKVVDLIILAVMMVMLIVQIITIAAAFNAPIDTSFIMTLTLSLMFVFIGNYLGKLRRNFWAGIRTSWTLSSEIVWERTHRVGGWLFVLGGLLGAVLSFVPIMRIYGILVIILGVTVITVIYSYVVYQRTTVDGKEPLSPPFD